MSLLLIKRFRIVQHDRMENDEAILYSSDSEVWVNEIIVHLKKLEISRYTFELIDRDEEHG